MSYDERDAAMDEMWDRMSDELRPGHIEEFTSARLRSYYVANPKIVASAFDVLGRAQELLLANHCAAALVFYLSAIELFLTVILLKPIVHGLVHNEALAEVIVKHSVPRQAGGQRGYIAYLVPIFRETTGIDIEKWMRPSGAKPILEELEPLRRRRNSIVHEGADCGVTEAQAARDVATGVFQLADEILHKLGLAVKVDKRLIVERGWAT